MLLLLLSLCLLVPAAAQDDFGGGYASLRPQQKRLVDDWFSRFSAVVKRPVGAAEGYDNLPLSAKTTFNAVTHALLMTKVTDDSGKSIAASAIELVDKVDTVAGQILGARGDEQFRIYVQMKPGALDLLSQSKEFKRSDDNKVYHRGYPICFRTTGAPSIQISLSRDASRADIDVDYRSAKFPAAFINGHLSAANSDVRVSDNDVRHNQQWAGLQNWWRNLLGLPFLEGRPAATNGRVIAQEPKRKDMKPAEAVFDFLNSWLVEQKPDESVAYFAPEALACLELAKQPSADRGMAKFVLLQNMLAANARIGKVASLAEASEGIAITGERLKPIEQPHRSEFLLYDVREDLAEEFKCANRLDSAEISPKAAKSKDFGKYVGALFRIQAKDRTGNIVATLWRKDSGYWKLISYQIDPQLDRSRIPDAGVERAAVPSLEFVDGDKDMIKAASDFLTLWLVKKDSDKALRYVAPECLPCVNLYRSDDTPAASGDDEARELLRRGMAKAAAAVAARSLDDAIVAPQPHHPDLKLVKHRHDNAFVIASIPEYMGDAAGCEHRNSDGNPDFRPGAATGYGKYYACGFSLKESEADPAVLWIVWSKIHGSWKAVSYVLLTP